MLSVMMPIQRIPAYFFHNGLTSKQGRHAMTVPQIRFNDGVGYERFMGIWSQSAGQQFLDWLALPNGLHWLDIGCGNGAFTRMVVEHGGPAKVDGIDPSEDQLIYARQRSGLEAVNFRQGDAMALPYSNDSVDVAVMPLVIFFVPDPAKGVAEMTRVVRSGGIVSAYTWDMYGRGFPYFTLQQALRDLGLAVPSPPSPEASRLDVLQALWNDAGLVDVETHVITVQRTYADFDDYWATVQFGPSVRKLLTTLTAEQVVTLQESLRARLPSPAADGSITCTARANAVKGRVQ